MTSPELQQGLQIAGKVQLTATATATAADAGADPASKTERISIRAGVP